MLKQFIEQISRDFGLQEPLSPLEDGSYMVILDPDIQISLKENPDSGITLHAILAPLPEEQTEEYLTYIMAANLLGRETGGSTFGLDKAGKQVTLLRFLPEKITYSDFHGFIEDFANYAEFWRQETLAFNQELKW